MSELSVILCRNLFIENEINWFNLIAIDLKLKIDLKLFKDLK